MARPKGSKNKPKPTGKKRGRKPGRKKGQQSSSAGQLSGTFAGQIQILKAERKKLMQKVKQIDKAIGLLSKLN